MVSQKETYFIVIEQKSKSLKRSWNLGMLHFKKSVMKTIILLACMVLCTLNSFGQNEYELSLVGEWELYSVLVDDAKDNSGNIHLKNIYDENESIICTFRTDNTYIMESKERILEIGSWNISNNGKKLTICKIDKEGAKTCESRKLYNGKHNYSDEEFEWFGEVCLLLNEKQEDTTWSQSSYKRKKSESLTQKKSDR